MTPSIRQGRPGILTGAVVGVMLTASLIAVFYLAWRLAGLPFVAFDVFDWLARRLPGSVVTFGIDAIVSVIRAIHLGPTAETAIITVVGAVVGNLIASKRRREIVEGELWSASHALPNAAAEVKPAPGTRPEFTPLEQHYRIDINTIPPAIKKDDWRLKIGGLVENPHAFTLDDLRGNYEPSRQFITLACISNPIAGDLIGTTRWTGVSLQRLLPNWRLKPEATHLKIRSADGFFEVVPLETVKADERVMLTYFGQPLPQIAID